MAKVQYIDKRFHGKSLKLIERANEIIDDYSKQGLTLTLRQLYYRFVAGALIENSLRSYKNIASLVNDARLAGYIDWEAIEDRLRGVRGYGGAGHPATAIRWAAWGYREDPWHDQPNNLEVWVEKDALSGVIEQACGIYRVPFLVCRGYTSQSEVWRASERIKESGKPTTIIHLGDHDPSGLDMTRDIEERLQLTFGVPNVTINRIALNMDQVRHYNPPPNPAKMTDSRADAYVAAFGSSSWELDALEPATLRDLINAKVKPLIDFEKWDAALAIEKANREELELLADTGNYRKAIQFLRNPPKPKKTRKPKK